MKKCSICKKETPKKDRNWLMPNEALSNQSFICNDCKER